MRQSSKKQSLILAITFLLVICFKAVHVFADGHHVHFSNYTESKKGTLITEAEEHCATCDFEFANFFVAPIQFFKIIYSTKNSFKLFVEKEKNYTSVFFLKNLRGPPTI